MRLSSRVTFKYNHKSLQFILFLYMQIGFITVRIAARSDWDSYCTIINLATSLHLSEIKQTSGSHYFLRLFANSSSWKLVCSVLRRVHVEEVYSSITQNLKFDWSILVMWKRRNIMRKHKYSLVQQHQSWQIRQLLSFLPVKAGHFHERNYYCNILSYL